MTDETRRRQLLGSLGAGIAASMTGCIGTIGAAGDAGPETSDVSLLLDWKANATHAGHFVAKQRGFYDEEGLSVELVSGDGGQSTAKQVGLGKYAFGLTSAAAVLQTRGEDTSLRAYAAAQQGPNSVVYTVDEVFGGPVEEPEQFAGKTIAVPSAASNLALLEAILADAGVRDEVEFLTVGWGELTSSMLSGNADASLGAFPDGIALEREGYQSSMFWIVDYIPTVGRSVVTDPTFADENPETVRAYLRGTARGWAWAASNPEAAMDAMIELEPRLSESRELGITKIRYTAAKLILTETVRENGWGWQSETDWDTVSGVLVDADFVPSDVSTDEAWTNDYLERDYDYIGSYADQVSMDYDV